MALYWTETKRAILIEYLKAGFDKKTIAKKMKKSPDAIKNAIERYDLNKYYKSPKVPSVSYQSIEDLDDVNFNEQKKKAKLLWNIPKPSKAKNPEKPFKVYLVTADHHVPEQNNPSLKAIFQLMDDVKFDGNIILGDFMDMSPISHWNQNKKKTLETRRIKEDYIQGNAVLDEFDKRLPLKCDKRFFYGNHEDWYFQLVEEMPVLEGMLAPKTELHLEKRGYKVYEKLNHIERIGRLSLTHGIYTSMHYVKKHIDEFKTNVMFGHMHSPRMRFESSPAKQIAIAGYALGCLCDMAPAYMKNRPNKWAHGFAVIYFYENGYFDVDLKRIVKGKFIFNNKLYDGNK